MCKKLIGENKSSTFVYNYGEAWWFMIKIRWVCAEHMGPWPHTKDFDRV